jgi:fumarylacetoacetase
MDLELDHTHDRDAVCWVQGADDPGTDFPVQNLPFGVYRKKGTTDVWRGCVAIGDYALDLAAADAETGPTLNVLAAAGRDTWRALRHRLFGLLTDPAQANRMGKFLSRLSDVELGCPIECPNYTDFYTSYYHAFNAGSLFRPDAPLTANFKWLPIAYHGRASSIVVSGTDIVRPQGLRVLPGKETPEFGPSVWLDYEVELGLIIGPGNPMSTSIPMDTAEDHIFGVVLLNDWSARDIQAFEYDPLGPFLAKSFATTISPWIVTLDALAPFRMPAFKRFEGDPECPAHLSSKANTKHGHLGIDVEAWLQPGNAERPHQISRASYASSYWTPAQLIAHHTSAGCPLIPGDILGTGTISGPSPEQAGALLELSRAGQSPIEIAPGVHRAFLEDDDTVTLKGSCQNSGYRNIGFGAAGARVLPVNREN